MKYASSLAFTFVILTFFAQSPRNVSAAELVTNGGFETGTFAGWTALNAPSPWYSWQTVTSGFNNGYMAPASVQQGIREAYQGVASNSGGSFTLSQDVAIPAGTASMTWKHRFQMDLNTFCSGAACGTAVYRVDLLNTSNVLLANFLTITVGNDQTLDTGWQDWQRNLTAFAGQTVRIRFSTTVSASYAGPGQLEIDAVSIQSPGLIPTAANVTVSGRAVSPSGRGIGNVVVSLTDSDGATRTAITSPIGYYVFEDIPVGVWIVSASAKRYRFANPTQVLSVNENVGDVDFISIE